MRIPTTRFLWITGRPLILNSRRILLGFADPLVGGEHHGIGDHSMGRALDDAHLLDLPLHVEVAVDDPDPPSFASAMASLDSVTVSMAADAIGMLIATRREMRVLTSVSLGRMLDRWGTRRTSSKVRPRRNSESMGYRLAAKGGRGWNCERLECRGLAWKSHPPAVREHHPQLERECAEEGQRRGERAGHPQREDPGVRLLERPRSGRLPERCRWSCDRGAKRSTTPPSGARRGRCAPAPRPASRTAAPSDRRRCGGTAPCGARRAQATKRPPAEDREGPSRTGKLASARRKAAATTRRSPSLFANNSGPPARARAPRPSRRAQSWVSRRGARGGARG